MLRTDGSEIVIGARRLRLGSVFVVPQYAFSLAALIVAGLIVKSLIALSGVDPGFEASHLITVEIQLPSASPSPYADRERVIRFYQTLLERAGAVPGVNAVTLDVAPPLTAGGCCLNGAAQIEGDAADEWPFYPDWRVVGEDYFRTMGIPLLRGRDFSSRDGHEAAPVVILNQLAATEMFGDADPLGRTIRLSSLDNNEEESDRWLTVVGVVADSKEHGLDRDPATAVYAPAFQHLDRARNLDLVTRVDGRPEGYLGTLRQIVTELDPSLAVGDVAAMDEVVRESIAQPRFRAALLAAFGILALSLALVGVYGVMSYSVAQRRREIAVRLALGAEGRDIVRMLTGEGVRFVILGQIGGTAAALALTRMLEGMLFGVPTTDATVFWLVSPLMAMVVLATCYLPMRRAGRVAPLEVLRG